MGSNEDKVAQLVDVGGLREYLTDVFGERRDLAIHHHPEGDSSEIFFLDFGDERFVLRRPPAEGMMGSAYDVLREYRVLKALGDSPLPVPETVLACEDPEVIGSEFYIMEYVDGSVFDGPDEPDRFANPDKREAISREVVDHLADLHAFDDEGTQLEDMGKPEGYMERQVSIFSSYLKDFAEERPDKRSLPTLEKVGTWLEEHVQPSRHHSLVHGDYRLGNLMFSRSADPKVVAILDWEMSTLGDPLTDLTWLLRHWQDSEDDDPIIPEWTSTCTENEGYFTRQELVERYERQTGIEFKRRRFYVTFALFREAIMGELGYMRYLSGEAVPSHFAAMEHRVPAIADRAKSVIDDGVDI